MRAWIRWRLRRPQLAPFDTFHARKARWLAQRPTRRPATVEVRFYAPAGTIHWDRTTIREDRP